MNSVAQIDKNTAVASSEAQNQQQYLTFVLNGELYAMGILAIKEIIEYGDLTSVPTMPSFIRGVINLRGAAVPVIDLGARFGKNSTEITRRTCIVIVEVANGELVQDIGVMVDAVNEVLEISAGEIEAVPSFGANISAEFIEGMGKINGKFVIILNVHQVLSVDEMATLQHVGSGALSNQ
ncbi:MAG: chemotaxis protein CheW [Gallionellaceae bacterium]